MHNSHNEVRELETESSWSFSRVKELENKNAELENEYRKLLSKHEEKKVESDALKERLNDMENNVLPSLRKDLSNVSLEKDASIVAREDALSQLRTLKKRMKETEEDQYRAEEDAAALRAELNALQQQALGSSFVGIPSTDDSTEHLQAMEKEIMDLKILLKHELSLRQDEQRKLAEQNLLASSLVAEKEELKNRVAALSTKASEESAEAAARKAFSAQDKDKLEKRLHDMAVMVERLENTRQTLLTEVDSQSTEIERLFEENSSLSSSYKEAMAIALQWENQVKACMKQNEELRHSLDTLRIENASLFGSIENASDSPVDTDGVRNLSAPSASNTEIQLLKEGLAKEQTRAEALAAEVMKLSSDLKHATQAHNNLFRLYRPVLRDIENSLMRMKQDSFVTIDTS